jgi:tRNA pseudouridine38-40 synthase
VSRSYLYQISRRRTAFAKPFVWWIREPLDVGAMRVSAQAFTGMQDFRAFTDDDPEDKSTVVLVDRIDIVETGALLLIRIQGSHFLWKMVRRLVGVLAAVGRGELSAADATAFVSDEPEDGQKTAARLTAPAAGLFLEGVYYRGEPGPGPIVSIVNIP